MKEKIITAAAPAAMGVHYRYWSLHHMLEAQRKAGYQSIELYCSMPQICMTPDGITERQELLNTVRASGMNVICVTPDNCMSPWQYAVKGRERVEQCRRYFKHALELAVDLNCTQVACHSGWGLLDEPREEAWKRSLDFMDWYCDQAERAGVTLVMESLREAESNLVHSLPTLRSYLKELGRDGVIKPMIDTCAMAVVGERMEEWFAAFSGEIAHMHFVDGTPYGHLAWGDGNRSLAEYMEVIRIYEYRGYLTQEITDGRYMECPAQADEQAYRILSEYMTEP